MYVRLRMTIYNCFVAVSLGKQVIRRGGVNGDDEADPPPAGNPGLPSKVQPAGVDTSSVAPVQGTRALFVAAGWLSPPADKSAGPTQAPPDVATGESRIMIRMPSRTGRGCRCDWSSVWVVCSCSTCEHISCKISPPSSPLRRRCCPEEAGWR